jgi:plastocyanin
LSARWRAAIAMAAGLVVMTSPAARGAEPASVHIHEYRFAPADLTLTSGSTVEWSNEDAAAHDIHVVSGPATFTSPRLAKGQMWHATLTVPGVYQYVCTIHPDMTASVTVTTPTTTTTAMSSTSTSTLSTTLVGAAATATPPKPPALPTRPVRSLARLAAVCVAVIAGSLVLLGRRRDA